MNSNKPKRGRPPKPEIEQTIQELPLNRYAVSLLFRIVNGSMVTSMLRSNIVKARSGNEAFGKYYSEKVKDEDIKNASLDLYTCIIIEDEES